MPRHPDYHKRKSAGLCVDCSQPRGNSSSGSWCQPCVDKRHTRIDKYKKEGKCINCGKQNNLRGSFVCESCSDVRSLAMRKIRHTRIVNKICTCCGFEPVTDSLECDLCRDTKGNPTKKYRVKTKIAVIYHYGKICQCCDEDNLQFLTIDHIDGGGTKHREELSSEIKGNLGSTGFYIWLKKNNYPKGFQTLCFNCNCGRAYNNGTCPHKNVSINIKDYMSEITFVKREDNILGCFVSYKSATNYIKEMCYLDDTYHRGDYETFQLPFEPTAVVPMPVKN